MGEEEVKKAETEIPVTLTSETAPPPPPPPPPPVAEATAKDVADEKALVPVEEKKADDSTKTAGDKIPDPPGKGGSIDRDVALTRVETEKRLSLIVAWEESEKTKAENKALRSKATIEAWENTKKANVEQKLKTIAEKLEKQKAEYIEKMNNQIALIHKEAEEKKAMVEAKRGEEVLMVEEKAAKFRATNSTPKKPIGCFGF